MAVCDEFEPEEDAIPQKRKTDSADPTEDNSMMLVTEKRSQSAPRAIPPTTDVALKRETSIVPVVCDSPIVSVEYDGRYVVGKK